jgi:hypothetical protein
MFEWDKNNLRKIRSHRIKAEEVERALSNDPIPIYEQDVDGEMRSSITARRKRDDCWLWSWWNIRVVTAYDLDAGQKRDYLARRLRGE